MVTLAAKALEPRKRPRQTRSRATVEAIFEATIQVLRVEGLRRLTTIRVAERAGASVGTLYQYYPNKQALLFGVLQRHLVRVGEAVGKAAAAVHRAPLATMVPAVVAAFVRAKTERIDEARALYVVAAELDARELVRATEDQGVVALAQMLATAADARFANLDLVTRVFLGAMVGPMRAMLEGEAPPRIRRALPAQLESLCLGYLQREACPAEAFGSPSRVKRSR